MDLMSDAAPLEFSLQGSAGSRAGVFSRVEGGLLFPPITTQLPWALHSFTHSRSEHLRPSYRWVTLFGDSIISLEFFLFGNSFIEIELTYPKTHPFKVHNPGELVYSESCSYRHDRFSSSLGDLSILPLISLGKCICFCIFLVRDILPN